ncbi:hypothetical protein FIS3754_11800 [Fischerella sp. NIES-3754]|nr:hypothetical protein FIS3754_11800 [Fischerella sp. NIES-3754]BCX07545.1 MAG: hypothetical protein KatS3mg066_1404 [Fischerella sp.]
MANDLQLMELCLKSLFRQDIFLTGITIECVTY